LSTMPRTGGTANQKRGLTIPSNRSSNPAGGNKRIKANKPAASAPALSPSSSSASNSTSSARAGNTAQQTQRTVTRNPKTHSKNRNDD
jgi:hypothetical protein